MVFKAIAAAIKPVAKVAGTIGSIASGVSSIASPFLANQGIQDANIANAQEAQKNRDFQERMSNTAYQRMVTDAHNAGINPIFLAGGGGASTPSGSMASMQDELGPALSTAREVSMNNAQVKQIKENTKNTKTERANIRKTNEVLSQTVAEKNANTNAANQSAESHRTQAEINKERVLTERLAQDKLKADTATSLANARQTLSQAKLSEAALAEALNKQGISKSQYGPYLTLMERLVPLGSSALDVVKTNSLLKNSKTNLDIKKETNQISKDKLNWLKTGN